ncbi:MAG: flagellar motor switch protein FliN [Phycisphaeraceae bacterium]|nr:flagellar motor switch protein FliN [Phycisphaeraceae bacterium]
MDEQNKPGEMGGETPAAEQPEGTAPEQEAGAVDAAMAAIQQAKSMNAKSGAGGRSGGPAPVELPDFTSAGDERVPEGIDLLADVNLNVKIELGRTRMVVEDVLRLGEGSVVELDKLAGDPVDVYVNDRHVAKGEVLVLNDNFCVRINEIVAQAGEEAA